MLRTILCIDDDRASADVLRARLDPGEYRVLQVAGPEEAFRLIGEEVPDLVLLEILLPQGDGLDLLERIRAEGGAASDVPVVVVTSGNRTPELYGRAIELGVLEFIIKPVLDSQLLDTVGEFTSKPTSETIAQLEQATRSGDTPLPGSGTLEKLAFPELLHRLHAGGASGVLIIEDGSERIGLQLRNGSPTTVTVGRQRESFEDYLLRSGIISAEAHERVSEQLAFGIGSPREILVGMGLLTEEECDEASCAQGEERLFGLFRRRVGTYRFEAGKRLKAANTLELGASVGRLIARGILEHTPREWIQDALESRAGLYVDAATSSIYSFDELSLPEAQRALIANAQGDRTLSELLDSDERQQRMLYALVVTRLLELSIDPVLVLLDEVPGPAPDALAMREAGAAAQPSQMAAPPLPETQCTRENEDSLGWLVELEATLSGLAKRFSGRDDFSVLEVGEDTSDAQVREAYQGWIARIPFDGIPESATALRKLAEKVRGRIERAYQNLADPSSRERYLLRHREQQERRRAEEVASRALEAEDWYRKGQGFLTLKKHEQALEAFGMAAHLDPEEGEYLSHLGWALYLSNPTESLVQKEALEHIAKGIKLSPEREQSYVYLGRIFKATGEIAMARKMFSRAVKLRPDCHPAQQELRLLEIRAQKREKSKRRFGWRGDG